MSRQTISVVVAMTSLMVGTAGWVWAQSGSRNTYPRSSGGASSSTRSSGVTGSPSQTRSGTSRRADEPFEVRFWSYLQQAQYRNWAPLAGQTDDFYPGNSPHGKKVKLYANRAAAAHPDDFPYGSILVKENYDNSGKALMAITVMYRSKGFDPENGDWVWTKYEPDGEVSVMNGMKLTGKVEMCAQCHKSAEGSDFVFANDGR